MWDKIKKSEMAFSNSSLQWHFPSTSHGKEDGFNDPAIEYFEGDHDESIAREMIQNSVDARLDYDKPVSVIFERFSISATDFPGREYLSDRFRRCLEFVSDQDKAEKFFRSAAVALKGDQISILKISDFNTFGLSGADDDRSGHWYRLVKVTGTSSPKGVGGGSFGIGKGAPFAGSVLRTVLYSSKNEKGEPVFQGVARLVSHYDEHKDVRQGIGFYGAEECKAVRKADLIPDLFKRHDLGTDIYIMGYKSGKDWQEWLIRSVLHNFWLAILRGDLEVTVKDGSERIITKGNLRECLNEYAVEDARFFFEAFTNCTQDFWKYLNHLGEVQLFVRKQEGYPSKIMMARKPKMLVYEKPYRVLREPYAGVFLCDNDRGNNLLRDLEPPSHKEWDKHRRLPDGSDGQAAMRELDDFIKESLRSMGEAVTSEPQDIPELDRYLPDSEERDYLPQQGDAFDETELSSEEETGREIGATKESMSAETEKVIRKGIVTRKEKGAVKPIPPHGPGKGHQGRVTGQEEGDQQGIRIKTSSISFRSFIQKTKDGPEYHFIITGREDCEGAIRLIAVGDDGNYPAELESATDINSGEHYEIKDSMIAGLSVKSGKTIKLAVRLASKKKYAIGIENYEG
jgi:hypothetical protein